MFAGMMADPRRHPQDWTEAEVRQEFRDWLDDRCYWVDAVPSPEPERETCPKCDDDLYDGRCGGCLRYPLDGSNCHCEPEPDEPLNAYEDTDGDQGEDAVRERQYERDHGIEP